MTYLNKIRIIENVNSIPPYSYNKVLELGLLIFYDENGDLQILDCINFINLNLDVDQIVSSTSFEVLDNNLFLVLESEIRKFNFNSSQFEFFCSTEEERLKVLNTNYCMGCTYKRKTNIRRFEIISTHNNKAIYKWIDDKNLILWDAKVHLFKTNHHGNIFSLDSKNDRKIWELEIDNGVPGKRFINRLSYKNLLIQKYLDKDKNHLLFINLNTGKIIWETQNTFSFYNYDKSNNKLYGLGVNKFEVINAANGEKELITEIKENIFVTPELTFLDKESLYFSSYLNHNIPVLGAVNIHTGELEFMQKVNLPGERSFRKGLERPYVVDNRLYVRDTLMTLHIFERKK